MRRKMYQPKLYLRFEPPIYGDAVGSKQLHKILGLIENEYSGVYWFEGQSPTEFNPFTDTEDEDVPDQIKSLTIGHWPDNPNLLTYGIWDDNDMNYQNAIDGWQWLRDRQVDFDKTSDIFSSLNENEEEIPKITYVFEPPIEDEETLRHVMHILNAEHPGLEWINGVSVLTYDIYSEVFDKTDAGVVGALSIGFFPEEPNQLSWSSWVDPDENWGSKVGVIDGWSLIKKYGIPNTEDVFDQLNESVGSDIQVGDFIIVKDYRQLLRSLTSALYLQPDKKYKIIEVIPNFGVTFINNSNLKHTLKFETIDKFFYVLKPNDFSGTEDVFNQLNESTYQPKLNLRFEEPIYEADELDKVLRVLEIAYPGLQWKGGDSITTHNVIRDGNEGGFEYDPIYYLTIGFFPHAPDRLTYTNGPDDDIGMADDEHHNYNWVDGWQWVKDNEVNYDETSDIFNQLNESYDFLGQTNLIGFKFKKTIENNPKLWVIRTVINDNGKELYFKYDFSDATRELLGSPDIYGGNLPQYGDMPKEKVIDLANNGDWEIIDMPTTDTEDIFNQLD